MRARYYDPLTQQFLTRDPVDLFGQPYVYANRNPVNYIDPTGLLAQVQDEDGSADDIRTPSNGGKPWPGGRSNGAGAAQAAATLEEVEAARQEHNIPRVQPDGKTKNVVAVLRAHGRQLVGWNSKAKTNGNKGELRPRAFEGQVKNRRAYEISYTHAETHTFIQLLEALGGARVLGDNGYLTVNSKPCPACHELLYDYARAVGLQSLTVIHPGGQFTVGP